MNGSSNQFCGMGNTSAVIGCHPARITATPPAEISREPKIQTPKANPSSSSLLEISDKNKLLCLSVLLILAYVMFKKS
jgi:hypothetical protein